MRQMFNGVDEFTALLLHLKWAQESFVQQVPGIGSVKFTAVIIKEYLLGHRDPRHYFCRIDIGSAVNYDATNMVKGREHARDITGRRLLLHPFDRGLQWITIKIGDVVGVGCIGAQDLTNMKIPVHVDERGPDALRYRMQALLNAGFQRTKSRTFVAID